MGKKKFKHLRDFAKMYDNNDGTRKILESIIAPEVEMALHDWISNNESDCVLIGGIALSFYVKPRYTVDIDVLFLSKEDIPENVPKFKRNRPSAFQHNKTHVEVELITPQLIDTPNETIKAVYNTSEIHDGIKIASPSGLVALKLGRFSLQDQADIESLTNYTKIDLTPFNLTQELINKYQKFCVKIGK